MKFNLMDSMDNVDYMDKMDSVDNTGGMDNVDKGRPDQSPCSPPIPHRPL